MKTVAIYCRISIENDDSLERQEEACRKYCEVNGFKIYKVYKDIISGAKLNRTEFNKLLYDMRHFKFNTIMVMKLDRIGRSLQHILSLFDEFKKKGVGFISVTQNIDLDNNPSSTSILQLQMLGAFAEFERNIISERTKEGLKGNVRVGKRGKDKLPRKKRGGLRAKIK